MLEVKILAMLSLIYISLFTIITIINILNPDNIIQNTLHNKFNLNIKNTLFFCFILSFLGTIGSLYLSEVRNLEPCKLCWFERIFLFPLVLIFFITWLKKDRNGMIISIPFILIGSLISLYHYLQQIFPTSESCEVVSCSSPYIWELGFISIPLMAFFNFFGILLILVNYKIVSTKEKHED
ncbi:MAG: disulfide bond formation protein B [Chloroflexi bacterium]|uniref:Disulfide bond formation protein B n=1 Tax=marine metagenome TaxID=408172 RepID=A0A382KW02_9ZZZZ|nr:disulfide bond formation protein B [Chloroflexota bacterium]|tara:strand:+ start:528 stop:1070 length:543 start_codon:yes stop_codon:yes gene_type:complete